MAKDSIALIGFMATGKTTIGKALAKYLGNDYKFIETDDIIIQETGKSIPRIFEKEGEEKFREYEVLACKKTAALNRVVISCGGGIVLNQKNIEILKKKCHIILLKATLEEIHNRIEKNGKDSRPIINKNDLKIKIKEVLNYREQYYYNAAEIVIDTSNKTIQNIVREIITKTHLNT